MRIKPIYEDSTIYSMQEDTLYVPFQARGYYFKVFKIISNKLF